MNIFSVLSTGKSNLHKPSMSSMLAFLLSPTQDHGLGRKFVDGFLEFADLERYRDFIDVQIKILGSDFEELHRIIIENKIKTNAANPNQLQRYYKAVLEGNDDAFVLGIDQLSVIFLTPSLTNKGLTDEFDNLRTPNKTWMFWDGKDTSLVKLIQTILDQESRGEISPINDYMRHTLKAFTHYVIKTISVVKGKNRVGEDIGEVKQRTEIKIGNNEFTVIRRDSGHFNLLTQFAF